MSISRTAICRGAIVKGFLAGHGGAGSHLTVVSTIARQSLGIKHAAEYNFAIHQTEDKYYDQVEGNWMAGNQMEWYMKKVAPRFQL